MLAHGSPGPPTVGRLLTDVHLDLLAVGVLAIGVTYVLGVRRLASRGRTWPRARTGCFLSGLVVVLVATQSGLAAYDRVLFSLHAVQHLLLGMAAPLLLMSGAPVTLALQASTRSRQRQILRALHLRTVRVVTHPITAWLGFGGTLVVLYFTGLHELSLRNEWVHVAVHAHFVVAGCLFMAHVVGIDPIPGALGYGARLLYVLVALPFHAFIGVAILGSGRVLASDWYTGLDRAWGASPLADQRTGAAILWVAGELFGVVAAMVVVVRWMAHDERAARRHDRRGDQSTVARPVVGSGAVADRG